MSAVKVYSLEDVNDKLWKDYIKTQTMTNYSHDLRWKKVIEKSFNFKSFYQLALRDKNVSGIFPLFLVKSIIFGKQLVSVPAANYGGIIASDDESFNALLEKGKKIVKKKNPRFLQIRSISKEDNFNYSLPFDDSYVTTRIKIDIPEDIILKNARHKIVQEIQKAEKSGVKSSFDKDYFDEFYKIYTHSMHRLGTPPYSKKYFRNILDIFNNDSYLLTCIYNNKVISSNIGVIFNNTIFSIVSGSLKEYRYLKSDTYFCWKTILYAKERRLKIYDMGRSLKGSGVAFFKSHWKGEEIGLKYYYFLNKARKIPKRNPNSRFYKILSKIWQMMPEKSTNKIGSAIIKGLN